MRRCETNLVCQGRGCFLYGAPEAPAWIQDSVPCKLAATRHQKRTFREGEERLSKEEDGKVRCLVEAFAAPQRGGDRPGHPFGVHPNGEIRLLWQFRLAGKAGLLDRYSRRG